MKKIRLTENELKRMIVNVMEQVADNNPNEEESYARYEEYNAKVESNFIMIYNTINEVIDLFKEVSKDTSLDPDDKDYLLDKMRGELGQLGVDSREYDYPDDDEEETIDVDSEDVTGDDDQNV